MEIYCQTKKMTRIIESEALIIKEFGTKIGKKLMQRISEFRAADSLDQISHLPPQKLHSLNGKYDGCFAVNVTENFRLVFEAYTVDEESTMIKSDATIIVIKEVVDYHGH